jgi:hypothetical protein
VKRVRFIAHAEAALLERGIARDWVMDTVLNPEHLEEDPACSGRKRAFRRIPEFGNRCLRVAYDTAPDELQVVTAFFDRRGGRRK